MYYLDYAKQVGDRWILNFFADTAEDLKDVPTNTPYITRNGTNYGIPLDTSVVTIVEKGVKVNYVLQQGKYIAGGDIAPVVAEKTITANGTYTAKSDNLDGFSSVTVEVEPSLQEKSQVPNANPVEVTPDEGYEGLSKVTVEAIPADYIIPNGTKSITANGESDIRAYARVDVNVQPKLQEKATTVNGPVVADSGFDGLSKVIVSMETPTEEKTVELALSAGNQVVTPATGKHLLKVTITKPATLLPENIKKGVVIAGVTGAYEATTTE